MEDSHAGHADSTPFFPARLRVCMCVCVLFTAVILEQQRERSLESGPLQCRSEKPQRPLTPICKKQTNKQKQSIISVDVESHPQSREIRVVNGLFLLQGGKTGRERELRRREGEGEELQLVETILVLADILDEALLGSSLNVGYVFHS